MPGISMQRLGRCAKCVYCRHTPTLKGVCLYLKSAGLLVLLLASFFMPLVLIVTAGTCPKTTCVVQSCIEQEATIGLLMREPNDANPSLIVKAADCLVGQRMVCWGCRLTDGKIQLWINNPLAYPAIIAMTVLAVPGWIWGAMTAVRALVRCCKQVKGEIATMDDPQITPQTV